MLLDQPPLQFGTVRLGGRKDDLQHAIHHTDVALVRCESLAAMAVAMHRVVDSHPVEPAEDGLRELVLVSLRSQIHIEEIPVRQRLDERGLDREPKIPECLRRDPPRPREAERHLHRAEVEVIAAVPLVVREDSLRVDLHRRDQRRPDARFQRCSGSEEALQRLGKQRGPSSVPPSSKGAPSLIAHSVH